MSSVVYVLTNEAMPGLVKIGKTDSGDPLRRMNQLYTTGVPLPFECEIAVAVEDDAKAAEVEAALHKAFSPHRLNPRREFFRMSPSLPAAILSVVEGEDVTADAQREMDTGMERGEKDAVRLQKERRPLLVMSELGIRGGDELEFTGVTTRENRTVTVTDASRNMLMVDGRELSFRDASVWFGERYANRRPAENWAHNGRGLVELYEELHSGQPRDSEDGD